MSSQHSKPFDLDFEMDCLVQARDSGFYKKSRDHELRIVEAFRSLEEQLEAKDKLAAFEREQWEYRENSLLEQLEAAQHERSVATSWAAELAGEKRALQASVEIIQQERDELLAQVRDHCSRPPGVCYPASPRGAVTTLFPDPDIDLRGASSPASTPDARKGGTDA